MVPLPRAYKTDESFLEKIAIGATGTRHVLSHLATQGHEPIELERGSGSFKIWKVIKIKRVRVPDILCLRCGLRVESRAKTKVEVSMSHSVSSAERGWDFGLRDDDVIAIVRCEKTGEGPLDWRGAPPVQYLRVADMRGAWTGGHVAQKRPKGAQEGFEIRVIWPSAIATVAGRVEALTERSIAYRVPDGKRANRVLRARGELSLRPLVKVGDEVLPGQILASVVAVSLELPCEHEVGIDAYLDLLTSRALPDRYTAVKALGHYKENGDEALTERVLDENEHIYVRAEAAAGLMRRGQPLGREFLARTLQDDYLENRLEAAIILGEVKSPAAAELLMHALEDDDQDPEIRAGAAWALGEIGSQHALPSLIGSFKALDPVIRIEAARALAKVAQAKPAAVVAAFPGSDLEQRPGIAWALGRAGRFSVSDLLPTMVDDDARAWVAYMIGTQGRERLVAEVERLAERDPEVYFAATVLWKILASWVYGLEEY